MIGLLALLGATLLSVCIVIGARWLDAKAWRRSLHWYRLRLPGGLTPEDAARWLAGVAASTHAPRGAFLVPPPLVLEVVATRDGIEHTVGMPASMTGTMLAGLAAALPGARLEALEARSDSVLATST